MTHKLNEESTTLFIYTIFLFFHMCTLNSDVAEPKRVALNQFKKYLRGRLK